MHMTRKPTANGKPTLYTVGHSTRSMEVFLEVLRDAGVGRLVDVRRYPASRRHPHFAKEPLETALAKAGVAYRHEPAMGGRRCARKDSPNTAWRNEGFRGYADHLRSAEFQRALGRLEAEATEAPTAVMCAEIVPWRCHRQLIADVFAVRGYEVVHLIEPEKAELHAPNPNARVGEDGVLVYPAPEDAQGELFRDAGNPAR